MFFSDEDQEVEIDQSQSLPNPFDQLDSSLGTYQSYDENRVILPPQQKIDQEYDAFSKEDAVHYQRDHSSSSSSSSSSLNLTSTTKTTDPTTTFVSSFIAPLSSATTTTTDTTIALTATTTTPNANESTRNITTRDQKTFFEEFNQRFPFYLYYKPTKTKVEPNDLILAKTEPSAQERLFKYTVKVLGVDKSSIQLNSQGTQISNCEGIRWNFEYQNKFYKNTELNPISGEMYKNALVSKICKSKTLNETSKRITDNHNITLYYILDLPNNSKYRLQFGVFCSMSHDGFLKWMKESIQEDQENKKSKKKRPQKNSTIVTTSTLADNTHVPESNVPTSASEHSSSSSTNIEETQKLKKRKRSSAEISSSIPKKSRKSDSVKKINHYFDPLKPKIVLDGDVNCLLSLDNVSLTKQKESNGVGDVGDEEENGIVPKIVLTTDDMEHFLSIIDITRDAVQALYHSATKTNIANSDSNLSHLSSDQNHPYKEEEKEVCLTVKPNNYLLECSNQNKVLTKTELQYFLEIIQTTRKALQMLLSSPQK